MYGSRVGADFNAATARYRALAAAEMAHLRSIVPADNRQAASQLHSIEESYEPAVRHRFGGFADDDLFRALCIRVDIRQLRTRVEAGEFAPGAEAPEARRTFPVGDNLAARNRAV